MHGYKAQQQAQQKEMQPQAKPGCNKLVMSEFTSHPTFLTHEEKPPGPWTVSWCGRALIA